MKDDNQDLTEQLRDDARRIHGTEEFDSKLHQDTMRRIRLVESGDASERGVPWSLLKVSATTAIVVITAVLVFRSGQPPVQSGADPGSEIALVAEPTPGSALAYRQAFSEGEDALMAMLDQDARVVLPRSPAVFESNP